MRMVQMASTEFIEMIEDRKKKERKGGRGYDVELVIVFRQAVGLVEKKEEKEEEEGPGF